MRKEMRRKQHMMDVRGARFPVADKKRGAMDAGHFRDENPQYMSMTDEIRGMFDHHSRSLDVADVVHGRLKIISNLSSFAAR